MVFYESPMRLQNTSWLYPVFPGPIGLRCVSRELSKKFEENKRLRPQEVQRSFQ